jgi:ADP-ribosylglycohydrolase
MKPKITVPARGIRISTSSYMDKVLGCWLGKNVGGTLGGPLEEHFGRDAMFDVSWYPDLPEGGIPNDDLELQLLFFQALQDIGPGVTARDLADYWLNCVAYNFDEYGLSKTNLVKGLAPPVSGWHNNWFRDCMGSPIRSEIWACVAPGAPEIAAHYAFQDAVCDHGGGESVFGEIFNAVVESCAFVEDDKVKLIRAGLSAIPRSSLTARSIRRALELYLDGVDWVRARNVIKAEFYCPLAQHSPINMGFQTIGLLYGENFEDAICKTVNCGWDTDSTGATVGAIFGILSGAKQLPSRWLAPLRDEISTNLSNGGIRHLRAPTDIHALTEQVCGMAPAVFRYWGADITFGEKVSSSIPEFTVNTGWLAEYDPSAIQWDLGTIRCALRYHLHAAIVGAEPSRFSLEVTNPYPVAIRGKITIQLPEEWSLLSPSSQEMLSLAGRDRVIIECVVSAPAHAIADTNRGSIRIEVEERPGLPDIPLVLLGGNRWLVSRVGEPLEGMEQLLSGPEEFQKAPEGWSEYWCSGNEIAVEPFFKGRPGALYLLHPIESPFAQEVILGFSNTGRMKMWLNGQLVHETAHSTFLRPNQGNGGGDHANYTGAFLKKGMNALLIRVDREDEPIAAHFVVALPDHVRIKCIGHPILGLRRTVFPWETNSGSDSFPESHTAGRTSPPEIPQSSQIIRAR